MMRVGSWMWCIVVAAGLLLSGCGKGDITPPKDATTETPTLDIDEGTQVSPDELQVTPPADAKEAPAK